MKHKIVEEEFFFGIYWFRFQKFYTIYFRLVKIHYKKSLISLKDCNILIAQLKLLLKTDIFYDQQKFHKLNLI